MTDVTCEDLDSATLLIKIVWYEELFVESGEGISEIISRPKNICTVLRFWMNCNV